MASQVYSDDFGSISVSGPIVRIDLMVQSASQQDSSGKPKLDAENQLVMPIDGILRAASRINHMVQELEKKGVVTRVAKTDEKPAPRSKKS